MDESSATVQKFLEKLFIDIHYLESKKFTVSDREVEFKLGELSFDMKMLCFIAGELSNAATYFSTFANVKQTESNDFKKYLKIDEKAEFKQWSYQKRIDDAAKVEDKKKQINKLNITTPTKRNKLTQYISTVLKSRQEEKPLVGAYVSLAKCEPLHLKNNCITVSKRCS